MKITELAIKRPITTTMIFLCLVVTGLITSRMLKLEFFPEVQFPGIFIQASYQNSTPEEIERLLTRPIEEAVATMSGIKQLRSWSNADNMNMFLTFDWEKNAALKGLEAREKIDAIRDELPDDLRRIFVFTGSTNDQPMMQLRISSKKDLSNAYELLDRSLRRPLERIEGVSRVDLYGLMKNEILIDIDPVRLQAHSLDINQVAQTLQTYNFTIAAGKITDNARRYRVKPVGEFTDIDQIKNIVIGPNNLLLKDIATIAKSQPKAFEGRHLDQTYAIGLSITREAGSNLVDVSTQVIQAIEKVERSSEFSGINLFVMDNQAEGVTESLTDISNAGLIGFALSILVLYIFLRQFKTTIIVSLAVPFSLCITLAFMYFLGMTLNILSMMGLMLAIGMLVDNAVVITESIFRYQKQHPESRLKAALLGVNEVGTAVFAGTVTTAIVFLPNIVGNKVGLTVFLSHVAITICISLAASLFIALTVIPLLLSKTGSKAKQQQDAAWLVNLTERYKRAVSWTLEHSIFSGLVCILLLASIAIPAQFVKNEGQSEDLNRRLLLQYHIEGKYQLDKIEQSVDKIEAFLYEHKQELDLESVYSYYTPELAQSTLILTPKEQATKTALEIREFVEKNVPDIPLGKPSFQRNFGGGKEGFSVRLIGDSTNELIKLSDDVVRVLNQTVGLKNAQPSIRSADKEVQIIIDREKAIQYGLSTFTIANTVSTALRGQFLRTFRTDEGETDVRVRVFDEQEIDLEALKRLPITIKGQTNLPLGALTHINIKPSVNTIQRIDRTTMLTITADLETDVTLEDVKPLVEKALNQMQFPPAYRWSYGLGFTQQNEDNQIMVTNMLLAVAMIYLVMAALFESLLLPSAVITSIIYSIVGVFWFFLVTGTNMTVMGMIGILVLMGVVVNNGIVLIDHINHLRKSGLPRNQAIIQGGADRLRPILMTVSTTILGLVPLALGDTAIGGGGPAYFPMARAIIGGLLFSTITTLLLLPTIYIGLDNLKNWWENEWKSINGLAIKHILREQ
jgi:hydrophobic/amphiphilic exporter-1 (mainly G- bacteria), HAE1 family